jgi:hypothetical protein
MIEEDIGGLLIPPDLAQWIKEEVEKGLIYISYAWSDEEHRWIVLDKGYRE